MPWGGSARTLHRDGRVGRWAGPLQGRTDGTDTDGTDTDSTDTDSTDTDSTDTDSTDKDTRDVSSYKVGVIGGDGIGPDVLAEALKVVDAAGVTLDTTEYELGAKRYIRTGEVLPDSVLEEISGQDAILLGAIGAAIGSTEVPPGTLERGLLLKFCTSCSRPPLGGFRHLAPPLTIHKVWRAGVPAPAAHRWCLAMRLTKQQAFCCYLSPVNPFFYITD